ncbi:hypothetical protein, partial [Intestinimonas sp.]|uniref:hypothetical protein n=1 Tax=Intestinimonas sp. TaxID=1965293 RepID=UPI003AAE7426
VLWEGGRVLHGIFAAYTQCATFPAGAYLQSNSIFSPVLIIHNASALTNNILLTQYGVYGILIGLSNRYWLGKINALALRPFSEAVPYGVLRSAAANASHSKGGA